MITVLDHCPPDAAEEADAASPHNPDTAQAANTSSPADAADRKAGKPKKSLVNFDFLQKLGKVLMKGFIFALSQLDELPSTILFYNGGATITTEGSPSLDDLKNMEAQGVEILTCGTCLDYYNLKDKLAVGSVTNMYTIVEKLANADKIIKQ